MLKYYTVTFFPPYILLIQLMCYFILLILMYMVREPLFPSCPNYLTHFKTFTYPRLHRLPLAILSFILSCTFLYELMSILIFFDYFTVLLTPKLSPPPDHPISVFILFSSNNHLMESKIK